MFPEFINTDVTTVKLCGKFILVGVGSYLKIYLKDKTLLCSLPILRCQAIHGIHINEENRCLVYGGKQVGIFDLLYIPPKAKNAVPKIEFYTSDDWIIDAKWIDSKRFALLTVHNTIHIRSINCLQCQTFKSNSNSLLYSGLIEVLESKEIIVFAGTAFSEILIISPISDKLFQRLKRHKGVIFSLALSLSKQILVSSSDDRSVIIWNIHSNQTRLAENLKAWENINIVCSHVLFGHSARVMKCIVTHSNIVSAGEDARINFWGLDGNLISSSQINSNACIWSLDADRSSVITGGSDGSLVLHPHSDIECISKLEPISIDKKYGHPKELCFTAEKNVILLTESSFLLYITKNSLNAILLLHNNTYKMLDSSKCKRFIATCDMSGCLDVFVEKCNNNPTLEPINKLKLDFGNITSINWNLKEQLTVCNESGKIAILDKKLDILYTFSLPNCREKCLTAVAVDDFLNIFVMGDRNGNINFFKPPQNEPIKTYKRVHGKYGPCSLYLQNNSLVSVGRDGTIKHFIISKDSIMQSHTTELPFSWPIRFIDEDKTILCGFREKKFVLYNVQTFTEFLEIPCGGGHRPWDVSNILANKTKCDNSILNMAYIQTGKLHWLDINMSKTNLIFIQEPFHTKLVNTLQWMKLNESSEIMLSGSEDTSVRIKINSKNSLQNLGVYKCLSSVRTLKTIEDDIEKDGKRVIIFSGGGRAQMCINTVHIYIENESVRYIPTQSNSYFLKQSDCKSEEFIDNRIMDLAVVKCDILNDLSSNLILAACSDGNLRLYKYSSNGQLFLLSDFKYHETCVLKVHMFKLQNEIIAFSMTTTGIVALWNFSMLNHSKHFNDLKPLFTWRPNKAGINAFDGLIISDNLYLLATGGDDNTVSLTLLGLDLSSESFSVKSEWSCSNWHCSQITGIKIVSNYIIVCSIDQRITVARWYIEKDEIYCDFLKQYFTDIADVQGICVNDFDGKQFSVLIYGKGIERLYLKLE